MVAAFTGFPARIRRRPHGGPATSHRYERRRPEKTPLHKIVSENLESWLAWREAAERPVPGYVEDELRGYLACGLLCFGFARAVCLTCRTGFVVAALTERVRRRVIRWFRLARLLDAAAAADMLAWENSGFSVDASVRITLIDRDVPSYFRSLVHLLRYCARPPFALERLSLIRDADGRIIRIRYVLPRHKAANWVGRGRGRKSTRPGASGVVELSPFEFLDRLADLVPRPRKHRHRYHGVFAPNHKLRRAVTALAVGNIGKPRGPVAGGHAAGGQPTEGCCCDTHQKPRSHDTSRIAWAKLMARVGEEFPLECPACGGDIRLIAFRPLSECETIPGLRTLGNLRLLRTSCPRTRGRSGRS
jgi:hypothetical protein